MKPPICDAAALDDWRANDEAPPAYHRHEPYNFSGETDHVPRKHTVSKEQKELGRLLARLAQEAYERQVRERRALCEKGELEGCRSVHPDPDRKGNLP